MFFFICKLMFLTSMGPQPVTTVDGQLSTSNDLTSSIVHSRGLEPLLFVTYST